jgi:glucose/arabinose dehydrogenase
MVPSGFGPEGIASVKAETVASGLVVPWAIAFLPNGEMLVTERPGRIRLVRGRKVLPPVATVPVLAKEEGGLLGLTLHPDFKQNRLFYIYFTAGTEDKPFNRIERWQLSSDYRSAAREKVIVDRIPAAEYHNGGRLQFGPDGMLYASTGDARNPALSQDVSSLAGKILRLTPDGAVPPDNPFPGEPAYLTGIRNVQGYAFRGNGTLLVADHGPSGELGRTGHDEVSVASAGDNLGWPVIYGCRQKPELVTPVLTWREAVPPGGAAIYTGDAIPEWKGSLLIGTLGSEHLHRVAFDWRDPIKVSAHEVYFRGEPPAGFGRLRDVVMGPDGHLYVTTSNCDGRGECSADKDKILRISR